MISWASWVSLLMADKPEFGIVVSHNEKDRCLAAY
jgi:hypothetical protein